MREEHQEAADAEAKDSAQAQCGDVQGSETYSKTKVDSGSVFIHDATMRYST